MHALSSPIPVPVQNADRSRALPALAAVAAKVAVKALPIAAKVAPKLTSISKLTKVIFSEALLVSVPSGLSSHAPYVV